MHSTVKLGRLGRPLPFLPECSRRFHSLRLLLSIMNEESIPTLQESLMSEFRIERDSMGEVKVPAQAYYAAQTQRAVENFPISGQPLPRRLIHALGLIKMASAMVNREL